MNVFICTLFENHYHYGVAALVNSLYKNGFRGNVYAGYRGSLPDWASDAKENTAIAWKDCRTFYAADGLQLHFLPLDTDYHLTNYKPTFFLELFNNVEKEADSMLYFDPDIVVKSKWAFLEKWIGLGVALVHEIIGNDMPPTHPIRLQWENIIAASGRKVMRQLHSYINGGFCGVSRKNIEFIYNWDVFIKIAISEYGCNPKKFSSFERGYPFWSIDQDAMNVSAMCSICPISEVGPEAMDFTYAGRIMSHATGTPKPWKKNFLSLLLKGKTPTHADKRFWQNCSEPIKIYSNSYISYKNTCINIASFIGRFYKKN